MPSVRAIAKTLDAVTGRRRISKKISIKAMTFLKSKV